MARIRKSKRGTNLPRVGGGGRKVKDKCINRKQRVYTAYKFVGAYFGMIIQSTWNRLYTTDSDKTDVSSNCVKNITYQKTKFKTSA